MTAATVLRDADMLTAFLLATREDWTEEDIRGAIAGADMLAYGWPHIARGLVALAFDPVGHPRNLTPAGGARREPQHGAGLPSSQEAAAEVAAVRDRLAAIAARRHTTREDQP